jgi:hypothetical protein
MIKRLEPALDERREYSQLNVGDEVLVAVDGMFCRGFVQGTITELDTLTGVMDLALSMSSFSDDWDLGTIQPTKLDLISEVMFISRISKGGE